MHSGIIQTILDFPDDNAIKVLKLDGGMDLPDIMAMILVETDGYTEAEATFKMDKPIEVFRKKSATDVQVAESSEEVEKLWRARKLVGSIAGRLRPDNVSEEVTVPISQVPKLLTGITAIVRKCGFPFVVFGHAGDGNLHPKIMYDRFNSDQANKIKDAVEEIFALTCALGGTLTGEHGIGLAKALYMKLEHDLVAFGVMRSIKKLLDPNDVLNPGKMNLNV